MLNALLNPDVIHVAYALTGAAFGWWIKRHPDVIPPELADIVKLLITRHQAGKQADAHETLQALAQPPKEVAK